MRDIGGGRQSTRKGPTRRQSLGGAALASLSQSAAEAGLRPRALGQGGSRARLQAVSAAVRQYVASLYQPPRFAPWPLHLLRVLRMVWLRQLFQVEPADHDSPRSRPQIELQRA